MTTSTTDSLQMAAISTATYSNNNYYFEEYNYNMDEMMVDNEDTGMIHNMTIYDEDFTNWFDNFMAENGYLPCDVTPAQKERLYHATRTRNANMIDEVTSEIAFNASQMYDDDIENEVEENNYLHGNVKANFIYMLYTTPFTEKDLNVMNELIEERRNLITRK